MGLVKLNARLQDPFLAPYFGQLLPKDHPRKTRFAINFFTSIGLGGLTYVACGSAVGYIISKACFTICLVNAHPFVDAIR